MSKLRLEALLTEELTQLGDLYLRRLKSAAVRGKDVVVSWRRQRER
jgi:hypothetical protein